MVTMGSEEEMSLCCSHCHCVACSPGLLVACRWASLRAVDCGVAIRAYRAHTGSSEMATRLEPQVAELLSLSKVIPRPAL